MDPKATAALLALVLCSSLAGCFGLREPIRILSIGAVLPADSPIVSILEPEPAAVQTLVPTRRASEMESDVAKRYVRLYFPKTAEILQEYDFVLYAAAPDVRPLTVTQVDMLRRATEGGTPALADQGGISSSEAFRQAWIASGLHEMFPNDASSVLSQGVEHSLGASTFTIDVREESGLPPVLTPFADLGIEGIVVSHGWHVVPKQGSRIWAEMEGLFPERGIEYPWLFSITYQEGLTWNLGDNFVSSFWGTFYGECRNPYRTDVLMNIIYYSTGRELPEDILQVHRQREGFADYLEQRRFLLGLIEFADNFGANTAPIHAGVEEADAVEADAEELYLEQEYELCQATMEEAFAMLSELGDTAVRAKDQALFWVYLSEWLATTATLIVSGLVVHQLMVRRVLYAPARTTTLVERE
jgi:hypothetical protein